jgi:hypothetical protein
MAPPSASRHAPWWKKLGWLILIWSASVLALAVCAWLLKMLMHVAGMTA